jgi:hypothetical protein
MRLPEIADRLRELSHTHRIPELYTLADELRRRKPRSVAPQAAASMTPVLRAKIFAFASTNPDRTQAEVGRMFNVNAGRVSEIMAGYRR